MTVLHLLQSSFPYSWLEVVAAVLQNLYSSNTGNQLFPSAVFYDWNIDLSPSSLRS
jgi:hypothetical protein